MDLMHFLVVACVICIFILFAAIIILFKQITNLTTLVFAMYEFLNKSCEFTLTNAEHIFNIYRKFKTDKEPENHTIN